jgi:hypothetical protein
MMAIEAREPGDVNLHGFVECRQRQLHEAVLDHVIWQWVLQQADPVAMHETRWLDQQGQQHLVRIDQAFLAAHRTILSALREDLAAVGADSTIALEGIFATRARALADELTWPDPRLPAPVLLTSVIPDPTVWPQPTLPPMGIDWPALFAHSAGIQARSHVLLRQTTATMRDARQACAAAATLQAQTRAAAVRDASG